MKKSLVGMVALMLLVCLIWIGSSGLSSTAVPNMKLDKVTVVEDNNSKLAGEKKKIDAAISSYLENNYSKYLEKGLSKKNPMDKVFEAHDLYGIESSNKKTYAYLWVTQMAFWDGDINRGDPTSNSSKPIAFTLDKNSNGSYSVIDYKTPEQGEGYFSSINKIFPKKYRDIILTRMNVSGLDEILAQKICNYFKTPMYYKSDVKPSGTKLNTTVSTSAYKANIPQDWQFSNAKNNNITFKKGNKVIGGIDIITNYISGANYMPLVFFNNVGIVKAYMTSGFLYKTFIVYLKNSQVHYLIMFNDYSYDLYFDTKQTEDSLTLSIAKSFRRKSTVSNNTLKDGELGKVTGAYFKEINFAKLIVVQSARVTNELHFIYTKELLKGISEQNLKNNDKVEITYLKNGYNELIPKSIKKVK